MSSNTQPPPHPFTDAQPTTTNPARGSNKGRAGQPQPNFLRIRVDSNGSTRGAFGNVAAEPTAQTLANPSQQSASVQRPSPKRVPRKPKSSKERRGNGRAPPSGGVPPVPSSTGGGGGNNQIILADAASLAMSSLDAGGMGGTDYSPPKQKRLSRPQMMYQAKRQSSTRGAFTSNVLNNVTDDAENANTSAMTRNSTMTLNGAKYLWDDDYEEQNNGNHYGSTNSNTTPYWEGNMTKENEKLRGIANDGNYQPTSGDFIKEDFNQPVSGHKEFDDYSEYTADNNDNLSSVPSKRAIVNYFIQFGVPYSECNMASQSLRNLLWNPENPEFTSLHQFTWAVLLGVMMGCLTAGWNTFIEKCLDFVWKDIPEKLLEYEFFTERDGIFPMVHYMWICPAVFGGFLSYVSVALPFSIPGQNEWIESLHRQGIMDIESFWYVLAISTGGMLSGLSLGPELPLVLLAGMAGSYLGKITQQSILSARVMNLTAAAAAIGGFFGFPMAGALFVLEIPHRMGLQYFEALSPATIASIVAVLVNRMVLQNDIKGYFDYPFLTTTLPSHIFYVAIVYGLVGSAFGVFYAKGCYKIKVATHDLFHHHEEKHDVTVPKVLEEDEKDAEFGEKVTLLGGGGAIHQPVIKQKSWLDKVLGFSIKNERIRAAVVGVIAGIVTGVVCMFVPHGLFWGEAQLQTLLDNGRTPLPVFGEPDEPTNDLLLYGYCLIDPENEHAVKNGFSIGCSALIVVTKVIVIGLALGTGIVGGHFWGPLYVGAAASNLFIGVIRHLTPYWNSLSIVSAYPCVALLCIMGSTHVVTFRAHTAIMLILTLTISAFAPDQENGYDLGGGDYSAVFPLLVVSCFVSLMITRGVVFYKEQRCRGDIIATPQVLCEPGKEGQPEYPEFERENDGFDRDDASRSWNGSSHESYDGISIMSSTDASEINQQQPKVVHSEVTHDEIEQQFANMQMANSGNALPVGASQAGAFQEYNSTNPYMSSANNVPQSSPPSSQQREAGRPRRANSVPLVVTETSPEKAELGALDTPSTIGTSPDSAFQNSNTQTTTTISGSTAAAHKSKIDELLAQPIRAKQKNSKKKHRRTQSDGFNLGTDVQLGSDYLRGRSSSYDRGDAGSIDGNARNSSRGNRNRSSSRGGDRSNCSTPTQGVLGKVNSFGDIVEFQPSLMQQARKRASSVVRNPTPPMVPKDSGGARGNKPGGHVRKDSGGSLSNYMSGETAGAISQDDLERAFSSVQNQANLENDGTIDNGNRSYTRQY